MKLIILCISILNALSTIQASGNDEACTVCNCDYTRVNCHSKGLTKVPNNIPSETTQLILGTNPIEIVENNSFNKLTELDRLYLDSTQISTLQPGAFKNLSIMTLLNLAENPNLKQLPSNLFEGLENLKELYLNKDNIEFLEKDIFKQLNSLSILQLQGNQLKSLEALYRGRIHNSTKLYISDNPLICCKNDFWTSEGISNESVSDEPQCREEVTNRVIKNVSNLGLPPPPIVHFRPTKNSTVYVYWTEVVGFAAVSESEIFYRADTNIQSELNKVISNTSSMLVGNLTFDLAYDLVVRSRHTDGKLSPANCPLKFTLSHYAPSNVTLKVYNSTSLVLNWDPPHIATGTIQSYDIYLTDNEGFGDIENFTTPHTTRTLWFTGLQEFAQYSVFIAAVSDLGMGPASTARNTTLADRPTEEPRNFSGITGIGATYITLSWDPPLEINRNGIISGYVLVFYRVGESADWSITTIKGTSYNVTELLPFVKYEFKIAAENNVGQGVNSTLTVKTKQNPPTVPRNLSVQSNGTKSICISWVIPEHTNGILSNYTIRVMEETQEVKMSVHVSNQTTEYNVTGLEEFTNYTIGVLASTEAGNGMISVITVQTLAARPNAAPSNLTNTTVSDRSIAITWDPIEDSELNGYLREYIIEYSNTDYLGVTTRNMSSSGTAHSYTLEKLHPAYTYNITVSVLNQIAQGARSDNLTVTTLEAKPSAAPSLLNLTAQSPFQITIQWKDPPVSERNGVLIGTGVQITRAGAGAGAGETELDTMYTTSTMFTYNNEESENPGFNEYSVSVFSRTLAGNGPDSEVKSIQTDTRVPGYPPINIVVSSPNSTSLRLGWQTNMDNYQFGIITKYEIHTAVSGEKDFLNTTVETNGQHTFSIIISNLNEYTQYDIGITPFTSAGAGVVGRTQNRTQQGVPLRAASDLRIRLIDDTSLNVTWSLPLEDDRNGIITQFGIRYRECSGSEYPGLNHIHVQDSQQKFSQQLRGLEIETCYKVQLSATTIAGSSNYTQSEISSKTLPKYVQCPRYYESKNYSEGTDVPDPCNNMPEGICMDREPLSYICMCPHGYKGDICNMKIEYCTRLNISCSGHGNCSNEIGDYTCDCNDSGYKGRNCSADINECVESKENPCNGGRCTNLNGSFSCECFRDFQGDYCNLTKVCTTTDPCLNGSQCMDTTIYGMSDYSCECLPGFDGKNCSARLKLCPANDSSLCQNNGTCKDIFNDYQCMCEGDFVGRNCEIRLGRASCRNETDIIYPQLTWLDTLPNTTAFIPCSNLAETLEGNIERECFGDNYWGVPDYSSCVRRQFRALRDQLNLNMTFNVQEAVDIMGQVSNITGDIINEAEGTGLLYPAELGIVNVSLVLLQNTFQLNASMNASLRRNGAIDSLQTLSNVFSENNEGSFRAIDSSNANVNGTTTNSFVESVDIIGSFLATDIGRVEIFKGNNFELQAVKTNDSETVLHNTNADIRISIGFPEQNSTPVSVTLAVFPNLVMFLPSSRNVASNVASISIDRGRMNETMGGVNIGFTSVKNSSNLSDTSQVIPECVFWDGELGKWSSEGLTLEGQSGNHYNCSSLHTTSFALLFNLIQKPPISEGERLAQSIVSYILTGVSLLALVTANGLYFLMGKAFLRKRINQVHLNFCIAYAIALLLFILQESAIGHPIPCKMFALLMHYSWLTVFSWSLSEGIFIYCKFVRMFSKHKKFEMTGLVLFGWLFPLVIVIPTFGSRFDDYGSSAGDQICFLEVGPPNWTYLAFIIPMILLLLANFIFLFIAIYSFGKATRGKDFKQRYKLLIFGSLVLLPVLGLPWLVGFLTLIPHSFFDWVFIFVAAPQGLWFFLIHVLRNAEIKKKLFGLLRRDLKGRRKFTGSTSVSQSVQSNMGVGTASKFRISRVQRSDSDRRVLFRSVKSENSTSMSVSGIERGDRFEMTEFNPKRESIYRRLSSSYNDVSTLTDPFDPQIPTLETDEKEFFEENFGIDLLFDEERTSQRLSLPLLELARDVILEAVTPSEEVEIDSSNLFIVSQIHSGAFSTSYKSVLTHTDSEKYVVCMRRAKEGISEEENIELKMMMEILKKLRHHKNILKLVGVSGYRDERPKYVLEYACYGQLHAYLEACKTKDASNKLVQRYGMISSHFKDACVKQIAAGMKYLEGEGFVHGDLAARNILVTRYLTCKITHIGARLHPQSPPIYFSPKPEAAAIPVRWTAPECVRTGERTGKSDVWAFGITCWEIYSEGTLPFKEQSDRAVTFELTSLQLQKAKVPERTGKMMELCMMINPSHRLNFEDLCDFINQRKLSSMNHPKKLFASLQERTASTGKILQRDPL